MKVAGKPPVGARTLEFMPRQTSTKQVWQCPTCNITYQSPIKILAAQCPNNHVRKSRDMKLVEDHTRK